MLTNIPPHRASSYSTLYPCAIRGRCSNDVGRGDYSPRLEVRTDRQNIVANAITTVVKDSMLFILYE